VLNSIVMQGIWTLVTDESGRFEPESAGETAGSRVIVLGGLLCPGEASELDLRWTRQLKGLCTALGLTYPPHATDLQEQHREAILAAACAAVAEAGGRWIFLAHSLPDQGNNDIVLYARMLGELIDFAARFLVRHGGHKLDIRPAQRSVPLLPAEAQRAEALGLERGARDSDGRVRVRTTAEAEVRQALEALRREPAGILPLPPELKSVEVLSAAGRIAHAGVQFADAGCNRLFRSLSQSNEVEAGEIRALFPGSLFTLVGRDALRRLRAVDRSFRTTPTDLVSAAREIQRSTAAERAVHPAVQAASHEVLNEFWSSTIDILANRAEQSVAQALFSMADLHLAAKTGSYEGVWTALSDGWSSDGPLATRLRSSVRDRELAARLWRVTLECSNHRGDVAAAERAEREFADVLRQGHSLVLLAEWQIVSNLSAVRLQNGLPTGTQDHDTVFKKIKDSVSSQVAAADAAGEVLQLAMSAPPTPPVGPENVDEARLWGALGITPSWSSPDRERGRHYGTAARSLGFIGDLDRARDLCLRARSFFSDSPMDLRFNASVLARVELERARLGKKRAPQPLLLAAMKLAGCNELEDPGACASAVQRNPGVRFALDLVLRQLLWTDADARQLEKWKRALKRDGSDSLLNALSAPELHTHPSELIARHAAELLEGDAAASNWFELSLAISDASAPGSTLRRFGEFTRQLQATAKYVGPHGCVTNPSFEYR
jgi:hypothetical protein